MHLQVGRFTAEEDEIIRRTVTEWDGNGVRQGLWIQLQNELGRRNDVIRKRWSAILAKRPTNAGLDNFAAGQQ
jgi:3-deoxy-D-manno-octulosonate 8-phosphate phosphatase KdsC-like HAD superfamily phosphatase